MTSNDPVKPKQVQNLIKATKIFKTVDPYMKILKLTMNI